MTEMPARAEGGDTEPAPRQHSKQTSALVRRPMNCRHLGRVAASPDPGTSRGRRPEAPDGVAPVGAILPTGEPETWDGWDSVDRPAVGTRNTHPLTATFPVVTRAVGGSACGGQPLAIRGRLATRRFVYGERTLSRAVKSPRTGPLVALAGGAG
jgi:hypothetical protein